MSNGIGDIGIEFSNRGLSDLVAAERAETGVGTMIPPLLLLDPGYIAFVAMANMRSVLLNIS